LNPIVHGEVGWLLAQSLPTRRDRWLVTGAGLLPDLDGLTILAGEDAYARWHHLVSHGIVAAVVGSVALAAFARARPRVLLLSFVAFHVHLLCDLLGSGRQWPIFYLWPFSDSQVDPFSWGWELSSWQNSLIGLGTTLLCLACALKFNRTIVELFSLKGDAAVVATLKKRFARG
jgi:hypothetical protein